MGKVDFQSLDMYQCQALHNDPAKVYVRKGKCFIYIGEMRYEVTPLPKEEQWEGGELSKGVETHNVDFSKDLTYEGKLYFNQNEEGWILGVINPSIRSNPLVVLRLEERPTIN